MTGLDSGSLRHRSGASQALLERDRIGRCAVAARRQLWRTPRKNPQRPKRRNAPRGGPGRPLRRCGCGGKFRGAPHRETGRWSPTTRAPRACQCAAPSSASASAHLPVLNARYRWGQGSSASCLRRTGCPLKFPTDDERAGQLWGGERPRISSRLSIAPKT